MITVNGLICPTCKDKIYSRTTHDMRFCSCGEIAIDGGFDYTKVSFKKAIPESVKLEIDASKDELYQDWNKNINKFGLIRVALSDKIE